MNLLSILDNIQEVLYFPPLTIETKIRRVTIGEQRVPLTKNEFYILLLLARTPETPFSPQKIYSEIWHLPDLEDVRVVRVHISRLRKKLDMACPNREFICTVWGQGYAFTTKNKSLTYKVDERRKAREF